ncbi:EcsC family protein, partial [Evtepia sp.]|uniref:EcsC family protein n=1 Tax=Evtepia sp. TaxID=2773933 RepID=UPI002A806E8F
YDKQVQIQRAAGGLSRELLYMKFLQGIPLVGAVGGVFNLVYMKQISGYANLKYQRRFLAGQHEPQEKSTGP